MSLGIALAIGGAAIAACACGGSGLGVGAAGEAASGVIAEDPNKFGQTLLLQALPGTQGIYGLLMAFLILAKVGMLGGDPAAVTTEQGLYLMFSGIPIGIVGILSGYAQGKCVASGLTLIAKRPGEIAKAIIYGAMVETFAILALLVSFLMYNSVALG
ncbi:MAG TPA: V-type ATP synthase subunit K [Anaerovoracaceae bacterium]|nr:V-type ATP synthase subunit K [Anaerovoracaceae bacterium]